MTRASRIALSLPLLFATALVAQTAGGPSGGTDGVAFSDHPPGEARVREVRIWSSPDAIDSIQVVWQSEDGFSDGVRHGGTAGVLNTFPLDRGEHITAIAGEYNRDGVSQITFETSEGRSSAPFGPGGGKRGHFAEFRYEAPKGFHVVGLVGRSGDRLYAVGALLEKL